MLQGYDSFFVSPGSPYMLLPNTSTLQTLPLNMHLIPQKCYRTIGKRNELKNGLGKILLKVIEIYGTNILYLPFERIMTHYSLTPKTWPRIFAIN